MKFNRYVLLIALAIPGKDYAQTHVDRSIPVQRGQVIEMHFDYPKLVRVSTWEGSEIVVTGTVNINGGENNEAFVLENSVQGHVVSVTSEIRNLKELPHRITVIDGEKRIMFRDKAALREYQAANGKHFNSMSWGPDIDVHLEIKVPRNTQTHITSVYGMVEVKDFAGPLTVEATYGGVDAALTERSVGELTAETDFGQIYTNLAFSFHDEAKKSRDFHTFVSARPGNGPKYSFGSKYGNVYLRKAETN